MLSEFAGEVRDAGAVVLAGRCLQDGVVPFAPFTEALRRIAGDPLPAWVVDELTRLLPELGPAGSAPAGSPRTRATGCSRRSPRRSGRRPAAGPCCWSIEDLHWADAATVGMLGHVVRTVGWAPLLVAGSRRDDEPGEPALGDLLDELGRAHRLERVAVPGLSAQEAGRLAGAWLRAEPARALADVLHRRTGGNPLFVEALARHLVESHPEDGADLAAAAGTEVPEGVRAVIDRRLARLPADAVGAVRLGAVAGEDFLLDDVARAGAVDDEATAEALEAAVAAGLVDAGGGPARYRFAHALVREAVLAGLSSTRRALLHRRMADALAEQPHRLPERARHLLDARPLADADVAARAALAAAALATQGLAYEDAAALLGRALEAGLAGHEPLRLELLLALGDARLRLGDGDGARTAFADAATLARARGDADALARAALGTTGIGVRVGPVRPEVQAALEEALAAVADDAPLRPVLLARLAIELYHVPPAGRREALSAEALAGGRRAGGRALLEALGARHVALWSPAHTEERLAIAGELVSAARAAGDREAELQGLNWRVVDLYELGELEALRATAAEHERLADALRLPAYAFFAPMWRASLALLAGRPATRPSDSTPAAPSSPGSRATTTRACCSRRSGSRSTPPAGGSRRTTRRSSCGGWRPRAHGPAGSWRSPSTATPPATGPRRATRSPRAWRRSPTPSPTRTGSTPRPASGCSPSASATARRRSCSTARWRPTGTGSSRSRVAAIAPGRRSSRSGCSRSRAPTAPRRPRISRRRSGPTTRSGPPSTRRRRGRRWPA